MKNAQRNWLLGVALELSKYIVVVVFGGTIFALTALVFEAFTLVEWIITLLLGWLWRMAIVAFCLLVTGVAMESCR